MAVSAWILRDWQAAASCRLFFRKAARIGSVSGNNSWFKSLRIPAWRGICAEGYPRVLWVKRWIRGLRPTARRVSSTWKTALRAASWSPSAFAIANCARAASTSPQSAGVARSAAKAKVWTLNRWNRSMTSAGSRPPLANRQETNRETEPGRGARLTRPWPRPQVDSAAPALSKIRTACRNASRSTPSGRSISPAANSRRSIAMAAAPRPFQEMTE